MFYDFSYDPRTYEAEDQYMFGPDYLVAPVYTYQATSRSVYLPKLLPENAVWQHFYTKQVYPGGERLEIDTSVNDFPLFIQTTSIITY